MLEFLIRSMKKKYYWAVLIVVILFIFYIAYFLFFGAWSTDTGPMYPSLKYVKDDACRNFKISYNCTDATKIMIIDFDANRNGKVNDTEDTLQALCEGYFGIEKGNQTACKEIVCKYECKE